MLRNSFLRVTIFVVLVLVGSAWAGGDKEKPSIPASALDNTQTPALQQRNPRYQIERGDVLVLNFPLTPEFNETITVQPDGFISLVGLGDTHAQGQTIPELTQSLRTAYANVLHDPVLYVSLQTFVNPSFTAYGQVGKPGKYDLHGDTTVSQAVAIAGGFTEKAKHSQVLLFRRVSNDMVETKKIDLKHMISSGNMAEDIHLQPGDIVYITKNELSKILPFLPLGDFKAGYIIP